MDRQQNERDTSQRDNNTSSPQSARDTTRGGSARAQSQAARDGAQAKEGSETQKTSGATEGAQSSHYTVELKAWIPHRRILDPEEPLRLSNQVDAIADIVGGVANIEFDSYYRGDNHAGYNGSNRVLAILDFDYDGTSITNLQANATCGASHRDWNWTAKILGMTVGSSSDSVSKTATPTENHSGSGQTFTLSFAAGNPLTIGPAPAIDATMTGTFDGAGNLSVSYNTDLFPSHGIRVKRDGRTINTTVTNDASGVPGLGVRAGVEIGARLMAQANSGNFNVAGAAPAASGDN